MVVPSSSPPPPPPPPSRLPPPPPPPKQQRPGESGNDLSSKAAVADVKQSNTSSATTCRNPPVASGKMTSLVEKGLESESGTGNCAMASRKLSVASNGASNNQEKTPAFRERDPSSHLYGICVEWRLREETEARRMLEMLQQGERVHFELSAQAQYLKFQAALALQSELFNTRLAEVVREESHLRATTMQQESIALQEIVLAHRLSCRELPSIEEMKVTTPRRWIPVPNQGNQHSVLRSLNVVKCSLHDSNGDPSRHLSMRWDSSLYLERVQGIVREEQVLRELIEDHQLSIRRHIVSLCICVFLSPFRLVHHLGQGEGGCGFVSHSKVPGVEVSALAPHGEAEQRVLSRDLQHFFMDIGYDYQTASAYAALFLQHGFGVSLGMQAFSEENKQRIYDVMQKVTREDLFCMGLLSVGEQTTLLARLRGASREAEECWTPPAVLGHSHPPGFSIAGQKSLYFTPSTLMTFRAACRRKMQHFDRLAQGKWDELRAAGNFRRDDEWQARWWCAVKEDWHAEMLWGRHMDRLMGVLKSSGVLALSAPPLPYITDSATARGQLLREKKADLLLY